MSDQSDLEEIKDGFLSDDCNSQKTYCNEYEKSNEQINLADIEMVDVDADVEA